MKYTDASCCVVTVEGWEVPGKVQLRFHDS